MAERYSRLFSLPENLYAEGVPVIISAGALLKDNQTGKVLVQLKFKNITPKTIKAMKVSVEAFDAFGVKLQGVDEYQYLDLAANRDAFFGSKTAFPLSDNVTRSFTVNIKSVIFRDGSIWENIGAEVRQLAEQRQIDAALGNLAQQYKRDTGSIANTLITEDRDLWICRCEAINKAHEEMCHKCGAEKAKLLDALDLELLKQRKAEHDAAEAKAEAERKEAEAKAEAERLAREKAARIELLSREIEERRERERKADAKRIRVAANKKKAKKIVSIVLPSIVAVVVIIILTVKVIIPNSKYNNAVAQMEAGNIIEAYEIFNALDGYKDSTKKASSIYDKYKLAKMKVAEVGDYVFFGTYEQDNNHYNGTEDLEWIVLEVKDDKMLIISKYALDCKQYNVINTEVTWETCSLRKWLNDDFINSAFSDDEKAILPIVTISADENPEYRTTPGNATLDRVFVLSITEVNRYFSSDKARQCNPTDYAIACGTDSADNGFCWWFLRSPGRSPSSAALVDHDGTVVAIGLSVNYDYFGIRPAIWIDTSAID